MGRMGHDSTRAALIYLHGAARADRVVANALPVDRLTCGGESESG